MTWNPLKLRRMVAIGCALLMAGCTIPPDGPQVISFARQGNTTFIVHDETTGCQYLLFARGITPRMWPDGTQVCVPRLKSPSRGDRGPRVGRGK